MLIYSTFEQGGGGGRWVVWLNDLAFWLCHWNRWDSHSQTNYQCLCKGYFFEMFVSYVLYSTFKKKCHLQIRVKTVRGAKLNPFGYSRSFLNEHSYSVTIVLGTCMHHGYVGSQIVSVSPNCNGQHEFSTPQVTPSDYMLITSLPGSMVQTLVLHSPCSHEEIKWLVPL